MPINDGFSQKRQTSDKNRLPPGQYETHDFPVLSLGPTPDVKTENWKLSITGLVDKSLSWNWKEFNSLPIEDIKTNIHCVTKWSKFDTKWRGVSLDYLMKTTGIENDAAFLIASSNDGYTTNIPLEDIRDGRAWVAVEYESGEIPAEHGEPARLFIPHLYFWKSAKWLNGLEFVPEDIPGFWEVRGYHNHGDPWKEERYSDF